MVVEWGQTWNCKHWLNFLPRTLMFNVQERLVWIIPNLVASKRLTGKTICSAARMSRLPAVSLIWSVAPAQLAALRILTISSLPAAYLFLSPMKGVSALVGNLSAHANDHADDMEVIRRQHGN